MSKTRGKISDNEGIIHLLKGNKKYVTIIPYEDFKAMRKSINRSKEFGEKSKDYELRFSEDVVVQLLEIYSGDAKKIYIFLKMLDILKIKPIPRGSEKLASGIYKTKIAELFVFYRISYRFKLVTILFVKPFA